jgi:ribonuclease P protein component
LNWRQAVALQHLTTIAVDMLLTPWSGTGPFFGARTYFEDGRLAGNVAPSPSRDNMPDESFPPQLHIRRGADFRRAYRRRASAADGQIVLFCYPNGLPHPRLGISASRRLGGAVVRNRWKRLIREAFRVACPQLPPGIDLVVVPRPNATPSLVKLLESLPRLAARAAKRM